MNVWTWIDIWIGLNVLVVNPITVGNFAFLFNLDRTACLVVNPITVGNFAFLFNCMPVGRTSDSIMVPT